MGKKNKNEIVNVIGELRKEFEKLIMTNPYLLKIILGKKNTKVTFENKKTNKCVEYDLEEDYNKYKKQSVFQNLLCFIMGFCFCCSILLIVVLQKDKSHTESNILSTIPYIIWIFTLLIAGWTNYLKAIVDNDFLFNKGVLTLIVLALGGILGYIANIKQNDLLLFACPVLGYLLVIASLIYVYNPLSSRKLEDAISKKAELIQKELDSLNKSIVQESHSKVLERIGKVQDEIKNNNLDNLSKIHSLTVLDSLRLELIQTSINGINLVEDWKYLDLSQKMIEEIMSSRNNRITMLGDLSFLSTKQGLKDLVEAVVNKNKMFNIYFTGEKTDNSEVISSEHCQNLVNNIKKEYPPSNSKEILTKIKTNVKLFPIPIKYFTGIGFIGLCKNVKDNNIVKYEKVFAYISSLLITEKDIDITRANPFVFTWSSDQTFYLEQFMQDELMTNNKLKVLIDGKAKERTEILKFD